MFSKLKTDYRFLVCFTSGINKIGLNARKRPRLAFNPKPRSAESPITVNDRARLAGLYTNENPRGSNYALWTCRNDPRQTDAMRKSSEKRYSYTRIYTDSAGNNCDLSREPIKYLSRETDKSIETNDTERVINVYACKNLSLCERVVLIYIRFRLISTSSAAINYTLYALRAFFRNNNK